MELRARTRPMLRRAGLLAALTALLVPAVAGTTTAAAKTRAPVVKKITPKRVYVGEKLTIRGHHFRRGVNKNTVAFKRRGAKAVFARADKATTKMIVITLPKRLEKVLVFKNGTPTATRLRVRVLSRKFGKRFTSRAKSPIVGPEKPPTPDKPETVDPNADCDGDHIINRRDTNDDNDLLTDAEERSLSKLLDTCNWDTDGDGVDDGYEYQSARDLNDDQYHGSVVPYPLKRPYPNPLDGTDADTDHDGDTLTLMDEYRLWKYTLTPGVTPSRTSLSYSAGEKYSKPALDPANYDKQDDFMAWANRADVKRATNLSLVDLSGFTLASPLGSLPTSWDADAGHSLLDFNGNDVVDAWEPEYYDEDGDLHLSDNERDEDADGLPNQWEASGCMTQDVWNGLYTDEQPYYLKYNRADFRLDDGDSDGDGVRDGADDEDHDNIPNVMECSRSLALAGLGWVAPNPQPWQGWVNPFNPCLPHIYSESCNNHIIVGAGAKAWAPWKPDGSMLSEYKIKN